MSANKTKEAIIAEYVENIPDHFTQNMKEWAESLIKCCVIEGHMWGRMQGIDDFVAEMQKNRTSQTKVVA